MSNTSYYLYKRQRRKENGQWEDVIPNVFSINANGTESKVVAEYDSTDCGYNYATYPLRKTVIDYNTVDCDAEKYVSALYVSNNNGQTYTQVTANTLVSVPSDSPTSEELSSCPQKPMYTVIYKDGQREEILCGNDTFTTSQDRNNITNLYVGRCTNSVNYKVLGDSVSAITIADDSQITNMGQSGNNTFSDLSSLKEIYLGNAISTIQDSILSNNPSLETLSLSYLTDVATIGHSFCMNDTKLSTIILPPNLGSFDYRFLYGTTSLYGVTLPSKLETIGDEFMGHSGLREITIPNSVTRIKDFFCVGCSSLTAVTIGSGVTSIGNYFLQECKNLYSLTINATTPPSLGATRPFYNTEIPDINVPSESVEAYKTHNDWKKYAPYIKAIGSSYEPQYRWINSGTTCQGYDKYNQEIKQQSTDRGRTWTNVTPTETQLGTLIEQNSTDCGYVPPSGTKLTMELTDGSTEQIDCNDSTDLTSSEISPYKSKIKIATIGDCVETIGYQAFWACTSLEELTIPNSVTSIDYGGFYFCSITSVTIPNSVTSIGDLAFRDCDKLKTVVIGNGLTKLGSQAFYSRNITSVIIQATTPPQYGNDAIPYGNIYVPSASLEAYKTAWNSISNRIYAMS